jgi:shikimate dehydrogenase
MIINNQTKIFISISRFPGSTGALLHNTGYKIQNLNCVYLPFECKKESQLKSIINNNNFSGISVSMPFKDKVIKYLDKLDKYALKTKSVNTIIKKNGSINGFNTDYFALKRIFKNKNLKINSATIIGNGSTSRTVFEILKELKVKKIFLTARNQKKYNSWKFYNSTELIKWKKRSDIISDIMINCTPMGMKDKNILPLNLRSKKQFKLIVDLPINQKTKLSKISKKLNIKYIDGQYISLLQGIEQYRLYNGRRLNLNKMKKILGYKI